MTAEQTAAWRNEWFPKEITGGAGSLGAEEVAAWFFDNFALKGKAGTLDYTQCCDMMHPDVAAEVMVCAGYSEEVAAILGKSWISQKRWIQWDRHTNAEFLKGIEAMPQGDPFGPLVLNTYMLAG